MSNAFVYSFDLFVSLQSVVNVVVQTTKIKRLAEAASFRTNMIQSSLNIIRKPLASIDVCPCITIACVHIMIPWVVSNTRVTLVSTIMYNIDNIQLQYILSI